MKKMIHSSRIGAGIAGAMLLGIATTEFFAASAPAAANIVTTLVGSAMLIASIVGVRLD
jgi:hypothetical protein